MKTWFMAKSAAVKASLVLASVLVVAAIGTGIYLGVKPSQTPVTNEVVSISDEKSPLTDAPATDENKEETNTESASVVEFVEETPMEEARVKEGFDLVNGDFSDGIFGFEVFAMNEGDIFYETSESGLTIRISDTGTEDWHIQLKQSDVRLENGRWYRLSLDAKSDVNRAITFAMMHDGLNDDNWTLYSPTKKVQLGSNWRTYSVIFQMNEKTDDHSVFNVSMGSIDGNRITKNHAISLNNIKLETLPSNFTDSMKSGDNLIGNPSFEYEDILWEASVVAPGRATTSFADNKATFNISNPGTVDWHVQLKQAGIALDKDQCYKLSFDVASSTARTIKVGIMDTQYVNWYGGGDLEVTPEKQTVTVEFKNTIAADNNALLMLSMGKIEGVDTPASTITLENFSLVKIDKLSEGNGSNPTTVFFDGWELYDHEAKHVTDAYYAWDDGFVMNIADTGSDTWHVQLTKKPIKLEKGKTYKFTFEAKTSSVKRTITNMIQHNGNLDGKWDTYTTSNKAELTQEWKKFEQTFTMPRDDENSVINFSMGYDISDPYTWFDYIGNHTVFIRNVSIGEVTLDDMSLLEALEFGAYEGAQATDEYKEGTRTVQITDNGEAEWHVQMKQGGLTLEEGKTYRIAFDVQSSIDRPIQYSFQDVNYDAYFADWGLSLKANEWVNVDKTFKMTKSTDKNVTLGFSMGSVPAGEKYAPHNIAFKNLVFEEVEVVDEPTDSDKWLISVNDEGKGEQWLNPADYGIENAEGKKVKVSVKLKNDSYFGGAIAGNPFDEEKLGKDWDQSPKFDQDADWTYVFESFKTVKIDIWWCGGTDVEIVDVKMEVIEGDMTETPADETKWIVTPDKNVAVEQIPAEAYNLGALVGKNVKITAVLESDGLFNGALGGGSEGYNDENWKQGDKFESADGSESTWIIEIPNFKGYGQIQFYWIAGTKVEVKSLSVEEIVSSDSETPAEAKWIVTPDKNVAVEQIPAEAYNLGALVGKNVKITAVLESDGLFNGALGGGSEGYNDENWKQGDKFESADGSESTWTIEIPNFKGYGQIQFYWIAGTKVEVKSLSVEEITPSEPETPSEPTTPAEPEIPSNEDDATNAWRIGEESVNFKAKDYGFDDIPWDQNINVSVTMISDGLFNGSVSGTNGAEWKQERFESAANTEITVTNSFDCYKDNSKLEIWYMEGTYIEIIEVKIEAVVAPPKASDSEENTENAEDTE